MSGTIDVRRDLAGLKIAADELYEESFRGKELDTLLAQMTLDDVEPVQILELVSNLTPPRTVSQGYHSWVLYLIWLRQMVELPGVTLELNADEAQGLLVLRSAENRYKASHPPCWKCGELNLRGSCMCRECGAEFKE